jgi:enhancer of polycomb-like protein
MPIAPSIGYSSPFGSTPAQIQLAIDRMGPPRALLPVEPVAPYEPPPEIPDISMLFASAPAPAALRSFVLPLGMHRQHCRPRIARGGRVVFDRKDPITREPYFERDGGGSDGDEGDENERTPVASIRA